MPTREELTMLQHLPLEVKVAKTQQRIREWVDFYGKDGVYVSFSGGKDSTVLLHLVRGMYGNDIPAVFVDTGLEYPEIKQFVKSFENVEILRPKMSFQEVLSKYGYPLIGKEIAESIYQYKLGYKSRQRKFNGERANKYGAKYDYSKWKPLLESNIPISHMCCSIMKKYPTKVYEKTTTKKPMLGTMANESILRETSWIKSGCNAFDNKRPISQPMSFWLKQDVLRYIKENNIPICSVYGDIISVDKDKNQYEASLTGEGKLKTTGCQRTGCIFCAFGAHHDTRFLDLKITHPKQYNYCMNGGEFIDGIWKPNKKGLGMRYVFDRVNEIYGKDFIKYV
jgi:3'-phosphoadenosine 5'-phosphosulfate sulfotransferase (PAPS reductase)/FAD synthetase